VSLIHSVALVLRPTASVFNLDDTKALHSVASNPHLKRKTPHGAGSSIWRCRGLGCRENIKKGAKSLSADWFLLGRLGKETGLLKRSARTTGG
jgi:hypothetical protein